MAHFSQKILSQRSFKFGSVFCPYALTISGDGTVWVGDAASGGTAGFLTVSDADNSGMSGGHLYVYNGSTLTNGDEAVLGDEPGEYGWATIDGTGSTWTNSGWLSVGNEGTGTIKVQNGGTVSSPRFYLGQNFSSTGTVTIDGAGSTLEHSGEPYPVLSVGTFGNGRLNIQNGGTVSSRNPGVGVSPSSTGTVTIDGAGSTWTNSHSLAIGGSTSSAGGIGTLDVRNNGLVQVDGTLKVWAQGTVNLDGGSIVVDTLDTAEGGAFNFIAGSITINSGLEIGSEGYFFNPSISAHQNVITPTTTILASRTLALNGGKLQTHSLLVDGSFLFNSGTLELTGGTVTGLSQLAVPTNGTLRASGQYPQISVSAATGSSITATSSLRIGRENDASGFYSNGHVDINNRYVTLFDLNDAVFDSGASVEMGDSGHGTIVAVNGLTLDFGGNIAGHGTIDTPNDPVKPLLNNGHITGNSPVEPITLPVYIKGVGTCDHCNITGTDAPGFSTATVNRGSVSYNGTLEIEIGGTSPGSTYDQLNHILGAGIADLGGTLNVQLIDGFAPSFGDTFDIITATDVQGTFDNELLPTLPGGLQCIVDYNANGVSLLISLLGDFDGDGDMDGYDFLAWQRGESPNPLSQSDLDAWQESFGNVASSIAAASTGVPEPTTGIMLVLGMAAMFFRRDVIVS